MSKNKSQNQNFTISAFLSESVKEVNIENIHKWKDEVMSTTQYGETFLSFTLCTIISLGALLKLGYQTYGMTGLPILLIFGTKSLEDENDEIQGTIQTVRDKLRKIQEKYHQNQRSKISAKDKFILKKLRKEEKILSSKQVKISNKLEVQNKKSCWKFISMFLKLLTPFRVAIGVACLSMSLLIMYSMLVNNFDRLLNSDCGMKCGFLLDKGPSYFNPLDSLLRRLSSFHENLWGIQLFLDTTLFSIILLYTFVCALYGIIKIGINFFSLEIYRMKRRDTMPQALSIVSMLVILMMFAFSMQLMSIAPTYVTFGDQKLNDGQACTLQESKTTQSDSS